MFHSLNQLRSIARFTLNQLLLLLLLWMISRNMKQRRFWTLVYSVTGSSILSDGKVTLFQKVLGNLQPISETRLRSFAHFISVILLNQDLQSKVTFITTISSCQLFFISSSLITLFNLSQFYLLRFASLRLASLRL